MRLIDADAVLEELKRMEVEMMPAKLAHIYTAVVVEDAPTIDAVPVVRCKDCKCWTEWANGTGSCNRFTLDWIGTDADDFCSMGERKDDDAR